MKGPSAIADAALEATIVGSFSRVGYEVRSRLGHWEEQFDLSGRRVLLTGGTSGIGLAAARRLVGSGAHVVITGRDRTRLDLAAAQIGEVGTVVADASDLDAVAALYDEAVGQLGGLDVVINNAGAMDHRFHRTNQGFERTYAVHVLAPFLLTARALADADTVITVSSGGMYSEGLHPATMQLGADDYDGVSAYAKAKRAQVALNQAWAQRHPDRPTFAAMHPGWADTPGVRTSLPRFRRLTGPILRTPDQGADTIVWLAATSVPSGKFWMDRHERGTTRLPWAGASHADIEACFEMVAGQLRPWLAGVDV